MSNIRQQVVTGIVNRLKTLTVANGYQSNAGARVYSQYPESINVEALPLVNVSDVSGQVTPSGRDELEHSLGIQIEAWISGGISTDAIARELLADIVKCVMNPEDRTLTGVCDSIQPADGGTIAVDQQSDKTVAKVSITFTATYKTLRGDWRTKA